MNLWNTRPWDQTGAAWNRLLEEAGFTVFHVPTVKVEIPEENPELVQAWEDFLEARGGQKHLLLTSPRALDGLLLHGLLPKESLLIWAVGEATGRKAAELGWGKVTWPPVEKGDEAAGRRALLALLQKGFARGDHLFWPRSSLSPLSTVVGLQPLAGLLLTPVTYRILEGAADREEALAAAQKADAVLCASPSAVRGLWETVEEKAPPVIPWGASTREEARRLRLSLADRALTYRVRGILQRQGGDNP
ncbi:MAG: uroporphyrinogen-III synthase [Bacillota bacterium]|nr:uroporphyrinogen-III synthase [Bacillota bacterium]